MVSVLVWGTSIQILKEAQRVLLKSGLQIRSKTNHWFLWKEKICRTSNRSTCTIMSEIIFHLSRSVTGWGRTSWLRWSMWHLKSMTVSGMLWLQEGVVLQINRQRGTHITISLATAKFTKPKEAQTKNNIFPSRRFQKLQPALTALMVNISHNLPKNNNSNHKRLRHRNTQLSSTNILCPRWQTISYRKKKANLSVVYKKTHAQEHRWILNLLSWRKYASSRIIQSSGAIRTANRTSRNWFLPRMRTSVASLEAMAMCRNFLTIRHMIVLLKILLFSLAMNVPFHLLWFHMCHLRWNKGVWTRSLPKVWSSIASVMPWRINRF